MTKVMVVEDDQSLREIYSIRLTAEGYEVVSAGDGEEALAVAVKERPDLIVSDVMMPKISGFDMLDILRSTPETKDVKVIMMTALSSDDQRKRGESLGADKYLVKSQVGIEDVINSVKEVLSGKSGTATVAPGVSVEANKQPAGMPAIPTAPATPAPAPATPSAPAVPVPPAPTTPAPVTPSLTPAQPAPTPTPTPTPGVPVTPAPVPSAPAVPVPQPTQPTVPAQPSPVPETSAPAPEVLTPASAPAPETPAPVSIPNTPEVPAAPVPPAA